jgi:uncharacterized protein YjbI with pentapeptide repeats
MADTPHRPFRPEPEHWITWPFLWGEWCLEWVVYGLSRLALFQLLALAGKAMILLTLVVWLRGAEARKQADIRQAWLVVSTAEGQGGSGGRIEALEYLNGEGVSLDALTAQGACLVGIQLKGAQLASASLAGAYLIEANLGGAILIEADLSEACLGRANLSEAHLIEANLSGADLSEADLSEANLIDAKLGGANLWGADLRRANLWGADLRRADLGRANLDGVNLSGVDLACVNLRHVKMVAPYDLKRAKNWQKAIYSPNLREELDLPEDYLEKVEWTPEEREYLAEKGLLSKEKGEGD